MNDNFEKKLIDIIGKKFKFIYEHNRADMYLNEYDFDIEIYNLKTVQSELKKFTETIKNELKLIENCNYFQIDIFFKIFKEQERKKTCGIIMDKIKKFIKEKKETIYESDNLEIKIYFTNRTEYISIPLTFLPNEKIKNTIKRYQILGQEKNFQYSFSFSGLHKTYAKNIQKKAEMKQIRTDSGLLIVGLENWTPNLLKSLDEEIKNFINRKNISHFVSEIFLIPYSIKKEEIIIDGLVTYRNTNPNSKLITENLRKKIIECIEKKFLKNQAKDIINDKISISTSRNIQLQPFII
ncbi:MAG: hypothetical protein WC663_03885 [Patescibacteria group bacterium]|jgi:hypothetical protein